MGKISWLRVLVGGILAGFAVMGAHFAGGYVYTVKAGADISVVLFVRSINAPWLHAPEFLMGLLIAWVYAAIRPRFGAGPRTAILAGFFTWFCGYIFPWVRLAPIIPSGGLAGGILLSVWAMLGCIVGGWLAGWVYREKKAGRGR